MLGSLRSKAATMVGAAALLSTAVVGLGAQPASATSAGTGAAFATAWSASGTTAIDLTADVTLTCTEGAATRSSSTPLTVDGHGFTIMQTCAGQGVLLQLGSGSVTLSNITVTGGDQAGSGGGIDSYGDLTVSGSAFRDNAASGEGGAIGTEQNAGLTLDNSVIADNSSGGSGGGVSASGFVSASRSTFSGNDSGNNGGALRTYSGIRLVNSTVVDNTSSGHGAITGGPITLAYDTIIHNDGGTSSNVDPNGASLTSFATVIADPLGGPNCAGITSLTTQGYNVEDGSSCGFGAGPGDQSALVTPLDLGSLADNGGATPTILPASTSPLVDAVPAASCDVPDLGITADQRGIARPQGSGCDIGAVEVAVTGSTTTTVSATSTTATGATSTTVVATPATPVAASPTYTG